jgi:transcriptional regulator of acetoin/glycerol metabolism
MAKRHGGEEANALAAETIDWISKHLGAGYRWPGNYRELEQCVRNFIIRREYRPARPRAAAEDLFAAARLGELTAEELLIRYCTLVYAKEGSYEAAARKLALDRRTVKAHIDPAMLQKIACSA